MTAIARAASSAAPPSTEKPSPRGAFETPRDDIARLKVLHAEAAETARFGHFLARATFVVLALGLAESFVAARSDSAPAPLVFWLILMGAGLIAVFSTYDRLAATAFESTNVRSMRRHLMAIVSYVGFAWGTAAFLVLAADASLQEYLLVSATTGAFVVLVLRQSNLSTCFLAPATLLPAAALLLIPEHPRLLDAGVIAGAGLAVWMIAKTLERVSLHGRQAVPYPFR
jgi:hypothetical protein